MGISEGDLELPMGAGGERVCGPGDSHAVLLLQRDTLLYDHRFRLLLLQQQLLMVTPRGVGVAVHELNSCATSIMVIVEHPVQGDGGLRGMGRWGTERVNGYANKLQIFNLRRFRGKLSD